jgi:hypothetical protein
MKITTLAFTLLLASAPVNAQNVTVTGDNNGNACTGNAQCTIGRPERRLTDAIAVKLLSLLPKGTRKVRLDSVMGDAEGARFAAQINNYLRGKGFDVDVGVGMFAGVPPSKVHVAQKLDASGVELITVGTNE